MNFIGSTIDASKLDVTWLGPLGDHQVKPDGPLAGPLDCQDLRGLILGLNKHHHFLLGERGTGRGAAPQDMLEVRITTTQGAVRAYSRIQL